MIRIFLPLICAALGLAAASCSQSEGSLAPAEAPAPSQPTSHGAASAAMASPADQAQAPASDPGSTPDPGPTADPGGSVLDPGSTPPGAQAPGPQPADEAAADQSAGTPAERRASTLIGMPVVSLEGSALGKVKDIVFDRQGRATHLVIAYGTEPQTGPEEAPEAGRPASSPDGKLTAMPWDAAAA